MEHAHALLEPFEQAHLRIVALEDPFGREKLHQNFDESVLVAFGGLAQRLKHEIIAVAVHDERRQQVGFAVDQPVRVGIFDHGLAKCCGAADALA